MEKNKQIIIQAGHLSKSFAVKSQDIQVLRDISLTIYKGDFLVLFGPSGCGKSTLLHILLGLEEPSSGSVMVLNKSIYKEFDEDGRTEFRKFHVGMVYQQPNWIKALTVIENIIFALKLNGSPSQNVIAKAESVLDTVGMRQWADYIPTELSSGQQQKISLARAIVTNPDIIIADEPTGNLDFESGRELMSLLQNLNEQGKTIIMVTHDLEYLTYANRAIRMLDGQIVKEITDPGDYIKKGIESLRSAK